MPPKKVLDPRSPEQKHFSERSLLLSDLSTLDEELELLRRFTDEAFPSPELSLDSRLQVHGRFRAEFLSICGRGEHLQPCIPPGDRPHRHAGLVMHLWHSFVMLRETFLTEMVLLPPPMEKVCLSIVLASECQAAACRVVSRLLHARTPNVERHLCAILMRTEALSHELRTAEIYGTALYDKARAAKKAKQQQMGISERVELSSVDPLISIRKQAALAQEGLKKLFPSKGEFAPTGRKVPAQYATAGSHALVKHGTEDHEAEDSHFEFMAIAGVHDSGLGFGTSAMPPEPVFVHRIEAGGWAEKHGVRAHDELFLVDEEHVEDMTSQSLVEALRRRPIRLTFAREMEGGPKGLGDAMTKSKGLLDDDHHYHLHKAPFEGFEGGPSIKESDEMGHREWLDGASDWFEGVVESARHMLEVADLDMFAFRPFMNYREEDEIGAIVGIMDARLKMGAEGAHTDLLNARALAALHEQSADFEDRTDERIMAAMELKAGGAWLFEGAGMKAAEVFKKALGKQPTPWPAYPGEQLNALASSVRREVHGAFLSI